MIRTIEIAMFGMFGASSLVANAMPSSIPGWLFQFGALGLCAFMILQNERQRRALIKILETKDAKVEEVTKQYAKAINRLAEALEDRPCVAGDQRVGK